MKKMRKTYIVLIFLSIFLIARNSHAATRGRVVVKNGTVLTDTGTLLRGHSMQINGTGDAKTNYVMNYDSWVQTKNLGFNFVRLNVKLSNTTPAMTIEQQIPKIDQAVAWARELGLYVMIESSVAPGTYNLSELKTFWNAVAGRYKDETHVFYEMINEPVSWYPSSYTNQNIADLKSVYDIMRSAAPNTHIVLWTFPRLNDGPTTVSVVQKMTGIDYTKTSVGFHWYNVSETAVKYLKAAYPVLMTETDWTSLAPDDVVNLSACERLGISWSHLAGKYATGTGGLSEFPDRIFPGMQAKGYYPWSSDQTSTTPSPTPTCTNLSFSSGSVSPTSVSTGGTYTLKCDYGSVVNSIEAVPGSGACDFTDFAGTTANFACTAGPAAGTFQNYCSVVSGKSSNTCDRKDGINDLTVTSSAPPPPATCTNLNFLSGSVSPSSVSPGGTYTFKCDYGTQVNSIDANPGSGSCTYTNFFGTAANFACTAGTTPGTFQNSCSLRTGTTSNTCAQQNSINGITVTGATQAFCGDGSCNNGETSSSCLQDCPAPTPTPTPTKTYSLFDFANLVKDWLKSLTGSPADTNLDNKVNSRDLGIMMSNWGETVTPLPPAQSCGDQSCNNGETCSTCPGDCGSCPEANTLLLGNNTQESGLLNANTNQAYLRLMAASSTGKAQEAYISYNNSNSAGCKMLLYDNSKNLLEAVLVPRTKTGWNSAPMSGTADITSGTQYYIGVVCPGYQEIDSSASALMKTVPASGGSSYTAPLNPLAGEYNLTGGNLSVYISGSSSGSTPPQSCGDGTCNNGETCSSCSGDCGTCPPPPAPTPAPDQTPSGNITISSISGTLSHGNTIKISGSGFGTKSPAKPMYWMPVEGSSIVADGALSASASAMGLNSADNWEINFADLPHSRSTKSMRCIPYTASPYTKRACTVKTTDSNGATRIFIFNRRKYAGTWFPPEGKGGMNYKIFRFWPVTDKTPDFIISYNNFQILPTGSLNFTNEGTTNLTSVGQVSGPNNQWFTEEVQAGQSDIDVANGSVRYWVNGKKYSRTTLPLRTTALPDLWYRWYIQNHWTALRIQPPDFPMDQPPPSGEYVYFDDIYIDNTWSRVMIGNASTFDASTHREPLIPTAWSASSVTAYFNQGSFANGSSAYLFVVDSNGNASAGKAITIGSSAN